MSNSREKNTELLRLILRKSSENPAALTPKAYAVWYEYLSADGRVALKAAMQALLDKQIPICDLRVGELFDRYLLDGTKDSHKDAREELATMIEKLSFFASTTSENASKFSGELSEGMAEIVAGKEGADLPVLMAALLAKAEIMSNSLQTLNFQLETSQSEIQRLQVELNQAKDDAVIDPLTGLLNRRGLDRCIHDLESEHAGRSACLLVIDIDHFKRVNDTYGHSFGDVVIGVVASVLRRGIKGKDYASRFGGEEFAVILPETDIHGGRIVAEQIRATIANGKVRGGKDGDELRSITVSVGVTSFLIGGKWDEAFTRADTALYTSKNTGRNRVSVL